MSSVTESKERLGSSYKPLLAVFWATTAIFVLLIAYIFAQDWIPNHQSIAPFVFISGFAAVTLLGIALIILAVRAKILKGLRKGFILAGVSALGVPVSGVLHNVVGGLLEVWFGKDFWTNLGVADEPVFFILALFVFPALFILSMAYCVFVYMKAKGDISA